MSDIKLFNVSNGSAQELQETSIAIEKTLQTLIESHLEVFRIQAHQKLRLC